MSRIEIAGPAHVRQTVRTSFALPLSSPYGATMMEVAIVIPFLFILIFGFIDIARYWQTKAAVSQAAAEGADRLVIDPNLKKQGSADATEAAQYTEAVAGTKHFVETRGSELIIQRSTPVHADITIPPTVDDYKKSPVEVTATATFNPILPIIWHDAIQVSTKVSAYVEPLKTTAEPIPTDCYGRLYDAFDPPGSPPYNTGCPCEKGKLSYTNAAGQCMCSGEGNPAVANGTTTRTDNSCGCADGQTPIVGYDWSYMANGGWTPEAVAAANAASTICCPAGTQQKCPGNQVRPGNVGTGQYACDCSCGSGASAGADGNCACDNPHEQYEADPEQGTSSCVCTLKSSDCSSPSTLDSNTCGCVCPSSNQQYDEASASCSCKPGIQASCEQSGGTLNTSTCACQCPSSMDSNGTSCQCKAALITKCQQSGGTIDSKTCACGGCGQGLSLDGACSCPNGGTLENGECNCGEDKTWDPQSGSCTCDAKIADGCTGAGGTLNASSCGCNCPSAKQNFDPKENACTCNPIYKSACEGSTTGTPAGTFNPETCACESCPEKSKLNSDGQGCECSGGSSLVGGSCQCTGGKVWDGYNCSCDLNSGAAQTCIESGGKLTSTCGCGSCPGHMQVKDDACACDVSSGYGLNCMNTGGTVDSTCNCSQCPTGANPNSAGSCVCSGSNRIISDHTCVCNQDSAYTKNCLKSGGQLDANCLCTVCPTGSTANSAGTCTCSAANTTMGGNGCACNLDSQYSKNCTASGGQLDSNCLCSSCPTGSVVSSSGACLCSGANQSMQNKICGCDLNSAYSKNCTASNGELSETCTCGSCPQGATPTASGSCACTNGSQKIQSGQCVCDASNALVKSCTDSGGQVGADCSCSCGQGILSAGRCTCPNGGTFSGGVCSCPTGKEWNGSSCVCDTSSEAAQKCLSSGGQLNATSCSCGSCPGGQTVQSGACSCPSGKTLQDGTCSCDPATVESCRDGGGTLNASTCSCGCPAGASMVNNTCTCPGYMTLTANGCTCPSRHNGYVVTQTSPTTCSESCDSNYYHVVGDNCVLNTCRDNCPVYDGQTGGCPGCGGNG
jgi:hypothetical protein